MKMPDRKLVTDDGSITFHSSDYDETYHSTSGALTEADKKYAEVCEIEALDHVDVLDICFGLGYNSAAAIDRFTGSGIRIVGLEQNEGIIAEILRMGDEYPFECREMMREVAEKGSYSNRADSSTEAKPCSENGATCGARLERARALPCNRTKQAGGAALVEVKLIMGDARETIKDLADDSFDCVFLDPFSPKKCPELWTKEFFDEVYRVLRIGGKVATYSCARVVRDNLVTAGFTVSDGPCVGRRSPGTVAEKK